MKKAFTLITLFCICFQFGHSQNSAIEFEYVRAYQDGYNIVFEWQTSLEMNMERFQIHKSDDPSHLSYSQVGQVPAMGFSTEPVLYDFEDKGGFEDSATYCYRLGVQDRNGMISYDDTVVCLKFLMAAIELDIDVYPNPTDDNATVRIEGLTDQRGAAFSLFDATGRLVVRRDGLQDGQYGFDLSQLAAGIYAYRVHSGKDNHKAGKLLIY